MTQTTNLFRKYARREDAAITVYGLFLSITLIVVGGLALDVANAVMVRTHLQVTADSAAHAALVSREYRTEAEAKAIAVSVAQASLPASHYGNTINDDDIYFGVWDASTGTFTPSSGSDDAVLVNTQRMQSRSNGVTMYFLRLAGLWNMDVVSQSVFETYYPTCFLEGFVAQELVDVQSNSVFGNGFCIHSNDHVELNNGNTFMDGTIVSMPDERDLVIPTDGFSSNPGLQDALRSGSYQFRILDRIDDIIAYVDDPTSDYFRTEYVDLDPVTNLPPPRVTLSHRDRLDETTWVDGAVHEVNCNAPSQSVRIPANTVLERGILITNCQVIFGANAEIHDILMVSTSTDDDAFTGASGTTIGRDDGCSAGGGAQLVTLGGMRFPSDLQVYGGQLIAAKDVEFAARPDGIEGISIVAGGHIDGSSLINVGFCNGVGMDNNFMAEYFRLVV